MPVAMLTVAVIQKDLPSVTVVSRLIQLLGAFLKGCGERLCLSLFGDSLPDYFVVMAYAAPSSFADTRAGDSSIGNPPTIL